MPVYSAALKSIQNQNTQYQIRKKMSKFSDHMTKMMNIYFDFWNNFLDYFYNNFCNSCTQFAGLFRNLGR